MKWADVKDAMLFILKHPPGMPVMPPPPTPLPEPEEIEQMMDRWNHKAREAKNGDCIVCGKSRHVCRLDQ